LVGTFTQARAWGEPRANNKKKVRIRITSRMSKPKTISFQSENALDVKGFTDVSKLDRKTQSPELKTANGVPDITAR
jgi:hypothetical protein